MKFVMEEEEELEWREGSVVRIKLHNFMTYTQAEVFPGPRLNVILGRDPSGSHVVRPGRVSNDQAVVSAESRGPSARALLVSRLFFSLSFFFAALSASSRSRAGFGCVF